MKINVTCLTEHNGSLTNEFIEDAKKSIESISKKYLQSIESELKGKSIDIEFKLFVPREEWICLSIDGNRDLAQKAKAILGV